MTTGPHPDPDLRQAALDRRNDVAALADMDDDQIGYLARVGELPDPVTDGLECDNEARH